MSRVLVHSLSIYGLSPIILFSKALSLGFVFPPKNSLANCFQMFSSTTNLFPHLSPPPPPFLGGDATDFFLHHYHHHHSDLLTADTLFGMVVSCKSPMRNQDEEASELNGQNGCPKSTTLPKAEKAAKKHKHSKIFTAQGLRDRRVRLSMETSRQFFGLQDMLGFEKASKTIDWLLKNSKAEIKDLMNKVKDSSSSEGTTMKEVKSTASKGKNVKLPRDRAAFDEGYLVSREARARARARARERARERTREKILRSKLK